MTARPVGDRTRSVAAIVAMATANGAAALGLDNLGEIAPGKAARFAFAEAEAEIEDPIAFLLSGEARLRRLEAS